MTATLLLLSCAVLSCVFGALGGYVAVRYFGRTGTPTPTSPSGYWCDYPHCPEPALPHRTHDGKRRCAAHKAT